MKKLFSIILSSLMIIGILLSAASCDRLAQGPITQKELLDGKTPKALYGESINKYKNKKKDRVPYTINVEWTFVDNADDLIVIDLAYGTDSISYKADTLLAGNSSKESVTYIDKMIYIESARGERRSFDTDRETADRYINEQTLVRHITPALPENIPNSWFDTLKFIPSPDGKYFTVTAKNKKAENHPLYSTFYESGVDCRLYFTPEGVLHITELDNVTIEGQKCNLKFTFSWEFDGNIPNPSDEAEFEYGGAFEFPNHDGPDGPGGDDGPDGPGGNDGPHGPGGNDGPDGPGGNTPPEHNHTPGQETIENEMSGDCTTVGGYDKVVRCTVEGCDFVFSFTHVSTGLCHNFNEWHETSEPYVSDYCGCTYYIDIQRVCQDCEKKEYTFRNEFDHIYGDYYIVEGDTSIPECQRIPIYEAKCTCTCGISVGGCDYAVVRKEGVAPGHTYENGKCIYCGISADSSHTHMPSAAVIENEVKASCTEGGSYDEVVYCSDASCKEEISRKTLMLAPLGHSFSNWTKMKVEEGLEFCPCTTDTIWMSSCDRCPETSMKMEEAPGHVWGEYVLAEKDPDDPICLAQPVYIAVCKVCYDESLLHCGCVDAICKPAPGHTYENGKCIYCGESDPEYHTPYEHFYFSEMDDGTYKISASLINPPPADIILPDTYKGKEISTLGDFYNSNANSIHLSKYIRRIDGYHIFGEGHNLQYVTVDEDNPYLCGDGYCAVTRDTKELILGCGHSVIPDGVVIIKEGAFVGCEVVESLTLPASVKRIEKDAFYNCYGLKTVNLNEGLEFIGDWAFYGSGALESIHIPSTVTYIDRYAYLFCANSLNSITVHPDNTFYHSDGNCIIETATNTLMYGCKNSTIPNYIEKINYYSFCYCSKLKEIIIPKSVKVIESWSFEACEEITIYCEAESQPAGWEDNWCDSNATVIWGYNSAPDEGSLEFALSDDGTYYIVTGIGTYNKPDLVIPSEHKGLPVKEVGYYALDGCENLEHLTIPDSITRAGQHAFSSCPNLKTVSIGNGLSCIDLDAFARCGSLQSVIIGNSLTYIADYAFYRCFSLKYIVIPESVNVIGWNAFEFCPSVEQVFYCGTESDWQNIDIYSFNEGLTSDVIYYYSETQPTEAGLFWHWVDGVPTVWEDAEISSWFIFTLLDDGTYEVKARDLNNLPSDLVIPKEHKGKPVTRIAENAFIGFRNFRSITIPDSIKYIGKDAFLEAYAQMLYIYDVGNWLNIVFENEGSNPDQHYAMSIYIFLDENSNEMTEIVVPEGITKIRDYAFARADTVTSITLPDGLIEIGEFAFTACYALKTINIPDSVTTIKPYAFYGSSNIESIVIPENVTYIGNNAFDSYRNFTIYCEASSKPSGWDENWHSSNIPVVWSYKA